MSAVQQASAARVLPKKENELFRTLVKSNETKQYKKGIKTAETILKKFPTHGETLAMKGLILNSMHKKEEAYEFVKLGLRHDVRSHVCWHVYGLVHRSDNNYKEASKCYLNALRIDADNQNILRDLSWLQIQMRDIPGFVVSRRRLLDSRPSIRPHWVAFAVANYLGKEYSVAYDVVSKYYESVNEKAEKYEESELLLFQNKCLEMQRKFDEGIEHLDVNESYIVDKLSWKVKKAEYFVLTGRWAEAKDLWLSLVISQTENYRLHAGLQCAYIEVEPDVALAMFQLKRLELPSTTLRLTDGQQALLRDLYAHEKLRSSRAVKKIVLTVVKDEEFRALLDEHCRNCLREGVPALYHDVCSLVRGEDPFIAGKIGVVTDPVDFRSHPVTVAVLELVQGYVSNLKEHGHFDSTADPSSDPEVPTALLWALFLQAHMLEKSGQVSEAMALIDECIEHTPTALDILMKKAKLVKKTGNFVQAAVIMDDMRALDLQDRYLNNKATKYFLRADMMKQAMETIALFTKHDGDPQETLFNLQCNWYELEAGESYARSKNWGMALKKLYSVRKHFFDYVDDMFDFHHYSMRKTTLRVYLDALAMQDQAYAHKFFQRAAKRSLQILLYLIDYPEDIDGLAHLSAAERKKERTKLKKKKTKEAQADEEKAAEAAAKWSGKDDDEKPVKDNDPRGEKLLQKDFLQEAADWCALFIPRAKDCDPETLALAADVMLRRQKLTQAARMVRCGLAADPLHPSLTLMLVKLCRRLRERDSEIAKLEAGSPARVKAEAVQSVLNSEASAMLGGLELHTFVAQYATRAKELASLPHLLGAARCLVVNAAAKKTAPAKQAAVKLLLEESVWAGRGVNVKNAQEVLKFLAQEVKMDAEALQFKAQARAVFPAAFAEPVAAAEASAADEEEDGAPAAAAAAGGGAAVAAGSKDA